MASRNELAVRAAAVGLDHTTITNDSKLEAKVQYLEQNTYATTGTLPSTTLTTSGVFADGETLTIGPVVYTFKTALTASTTANQVKIGAAATNTLDNLKDAINATASVGVPGTDYGSNTVRHPWATAGAKGASTLVISASDKNVGGGAATTETCTNASLTAATFNNGVLSAIAQDTTNNYGPTGLSGAVDHR